MSSKLRPDPPARQPDRSSTSPSPAGTPPRCSNLRAALRGWWAGARGCQRLAYLVGARLVVVGLAHAAIWALAVGRRLNAPAVRDPAFQDQLQRPRRAALATGVLDAPAMARVEVEDLPVSPDRHAALDPAVASPATATPKPSPQAGKDLSLPSR
jgi:hypothetical protein